ncbi:MAG: cyclic-phosphate processing receiver domain-containing protein [Pseudomonadota bacterium]
MWLILEDNLQRMQAFQEVADAFALPQTLRLWRIASEMIGEIGPLLPNASVISLDHDLYRHEADDPEPGTGRDVANYLAGFGPVCPVIIHSTNTDAAWGMYNELSYAKWQVALVHHLDEPEWIQEKWLSTVRKLKAY